MIDFLLVFVLVVFAVACVMEILKTIVNAVGTAFRKGGAFGVPSWVWWLIGGILSVAGAFFARLALLGSEEPMTALLGVLTSVWMLWAWASLIWWVQMQLDMKVIKTYAVPIIKKLINRKTGVDDV